MRWHSTLLFGYIGAASFYSGSLSQSFPSTTIAGQSQGQASPPGVNFITYGPDEYQLGPLAINLRAYWVQGRVKRMCLSLKQLFGLIANPMFLPPCLVELLREIANPVDGVSLMMVQVYRLYYHGVHLKNLAVVDGVEMPSSWFLDPELQPSAFEATSSRSESPQNASPSNIGEGLVRSEVGLFTMELSNNGSTGGKLSTGGNGSIGEASFYKQGNLSNGGSSGQLSLLQTSTSPPPSLTSSPGALSPAHGSQDATRAEMTQIQVLQLLRRQSWIIPKTEGIKEELVRNGKVSGAISTEGIFTLIDDYRDSLDGAAFPTTQK